MNSDKDTIIAMKGTAVQTQVRFVQTKYGKEGFERWASSLAPEAEAVVREPVLVSKWYEGESFVVGLRAKICELFFDGDPEGARELGRFSAEKGLKGVYKVFLRFGSPSWVAERTTLIFDTYFRPGKVTVTLNEKNRAHAIIRGFPDSSGLVELTIAGFTEQALTMSGVKNVRVEIVKSYSRGDGYIEIHTTWD